MGLLLKKYKTRFRYSLQPMFALLEAKEKTLRHDEWQSFVKKTQERILLNPIDYLGMDIPDESLLKDIIEEIFIEFFKDQKVKRKAMLDDLIGKER